MMQGRTPMQQVAIGQGCSHCEDGHPIEQIQVGRGERKVVINLCLDCVMLWFPDKTVEWWEARHAEFADHIGQALKRAAAKERTRNYDALVAHQREAVLL